MNFTLTLQTQWVDWEGEVKKMRREEVYFFTSFLRRWRQITGEVWGWCLKNRTHIHTHVHSDTVQLEPAAAVYPTTSNAAVLPREQGYALGLWAEQQSQGQGEVCPWRGTKSMWGRLSLKREMWRIFDLTSEEPNKEKDPPKTRKSLLTAKLGNNPCPGKGNHSGKISRLQIVSQRLTFYCSTQFLTCGTFAEKNDFLKSSWVVSVQTLGWHN